MNGHPPRRSLTRVYCGLMFIGSVATPASAQPMVIVPSSNDLAANEIQRISDLSEQLRSQETNARLRAIHAMADSPSQSIHLFHQLIALTTAEEVNNRLASIAALSRRHTSELVAPVETALRIALDDPDPRVRTAAIHALGTRKTITRDSADRLAILLQDEDGDVQFAVLDLLWQCPELRNELLPKVVPLMTSQAMRSRAISIDFYDQLPLAWDAARVVYVENVRSYGSLNQELEKWIAQTTDSRIKFILAMSIDPEAALPGKAIKMINDAAQRNDAVEQRALFDEIYELPIRAATRIRLLLEISKLNTEIGREAARAFVSEYPDWYLIEADLPQAVQDKQIHEWLRTAIQEWLNDHKE